jgi:outer membrane PBP1 activator LpoA protein
MLGSEAPFYSTSSANPGTAPGQAMAELDGLHLLDLPWLVQLDHPSVMVYPRRTGGGAHQLDLDRLYALGIDAFRVAREIAKKPEAAFQLDGVTGKLAISFGQGASRFERLHPAVVYQGGAYRAATAGR